MNRVYIILVSLTAMAAVTASGANAQDNSSANLKPYSVGPAIEFSGGGTSFGIKGRISNPGVPVSVRPIVLFGYTPTVNGATFTQALTNGVNNFSNFAALTPEQRRAQIKLIVDFPLTEQQADDVAKKLSLALAIDPTTRTAEQDFYVGRALSTVFDYNLEAFKNLTPAQQQAQVKLFLPNATDAVVATTVSALDAALKTPFNNRTPAQRETISNAQGVLNTTNLSGFSSLTPAQQKEQVGILANNAKPLIDSQLDAAANSLIAVLNTPAANRTEFQKETLSFAQQNVAYIANTQAIGFTPGSGTAYGAAITYDFESADKKLMGYFGPRILFATGSSKVGNFDTSTTETSIGALIGADYAISGDLTAGLNATYNFSKSGTLSVSGPGGFNGSAPISGNSSFDIGMSLGYRF
ncbi:opacity family porin [Chamaesiphon sp.]|uniref:opacity family porin n=1 Tax=Chamaesiphon sp. TaxID=2814140 RepID=UPI003594100F